MSTRARFAWSMAGILIAGAVPAAVRAASAPPRPAVAVVQVGNYIFNADGNTGTQVDTVKVLVGDTVTWQWAAGTHTITNGTGPTDPNAGLLFDAPSDATDTSFSFTFNNPGVVPYFCSNHTPQNMRGFVSVGQPVGVAPGTPSGVARFAREPWPNPSRGAVEMRVFLPSAGTIDLAVFDERGRRIASVFEGERGPGEWAFRWDGRDARGHAAASGFYFLRLLSGGIQDSRRVVVQH